MKHEQTPDDIVAGIPEAMRGKVFHLLGVALGHHGTVSAQDTTGDSGGNNPPPPPPPHG